jgi:hypothetical protein
MRLVILSTCITILPSMEGIILDGMDGVKLIFHNFVGDMNAIVQMKVITFMEKVALMLVELWITILKLAITFWKHVIIG